MNRRTADSADDTARRRRAWKRGRLAEMAARMHLRFKGYSVIGWNIRTPAGELDIVARRRDLIVFAEVKARHDWDSAAESLGPRQMARISRAAEAFLAKRPDLAAARIRFDVLLVRPWRWPRHMADAWRPRRP